MNMQNIKDNTVAQDDEFLKCSFEETAKILFGAAIFAVKDN
ncbi:hypothetical protein PROFUN_14461 [Planoprotostelium fungivorum]|uniref:Uncharacterized protein n=1 Tax=Planoprotostelium fungivorum TaxID=1890364 RepID=A0A2P6MXC5_9EUKA|nr:hypothetical protein PROFUN_14461 [Planoprotostelium fungivorum]